MHEIAAPTLAPVRRLRVAMVSFDFAEFCLPLARGMSTSADVLLQLPSRCGKGHGRRPCDVVEEDPGDVDLQTFRRPRLRQPVRQAAMVSTLMSRVRRFQPDVVHLQQGHLWFNFGLPLLGRRLPLVVTVHDARPHHGDRPSAKTPQWTANRAFVAADHLIAHSHAVRDELVGPLGFQPDRVSVVPLGAAEIGVPVAPRSGGPPTVLFFGRIWPYKGLEYLAAAEAAVSAAVPDVRFIVAGDGEPWSAYERFAAHPERFDVRAGRVPDLEVPALFAEATVVVLPYADATQSGVATLAYRFGRPVVATSVRGLAEQVRDGVTGLLVPPRDPVALASALVRVLTDAELARRIAEGGRQLARDELSPTAVAEQTLEVYRRVVDRSRAGR